jgi:hypothetical protein
MTKADLSALQAAADHAIAYREAVAIAEHTPVVDYRTLQAVFAAPTPETATDPKATIDELVKLATPGIRAQTGPRFFGWVIGHSHPAGVAADWLASHPRLRRLPQGGSSTCSDCHRTHRSALLPAPQ